MAQQVPISQPQNISLFPPPPSFSMNYTSENVKNKMAFLSPPPVPNKFEVYGESYDLEGPLLPSLTEMGCQQLYSASGNWRSELMKLNRSLVAAFLDLIEILIKCPDNEDRQEKIETIRTLFINIHHLINEYRPVQARDTLRHLIKHQNSEIARVTEKLSKYTETATAALDSLYKTLQHFSVDETLPQAPINIIMEKMEIDVEQQTSIQSSSQQNLTKPIEVVVTNRLTRREIGGASQTQILQILKQFNFM